MKAAAAAKEATAVAARELASREGLAAGDRFASGEGLAAGQGQARPGPRSAAAAVAVPSPGSILRQPLQVPDALGADIDRVLEDLILATTALDWEATAGGGPLHAAAATSLDVGVTEGAEPLCAAAAAAAVCLDAEEEAWSGAHTNAAAAGLGEEVEVPAHLGVQVAGPAQLGVQVAGPAQLGVQVEVPAHLGVEVEGPAQLGEDVEGSTTEAGCPAASPSAAVSEDGAAIDRLLDDIIASTVLEAAVDRMLEEMITAADLGAAMDLDPEAVVDLDPDLAAVVDREAGVADDRRLDATLMGAGQGDTSASLSPAPSSTSSTPPLTRCSSLAAETAPASSSTSGRGDRSDATGGGGAGPDCYSEEHPAAGGGGSCYSRRSDNGLGGVGSYSRRSLLFECFAAAQAGGGQPGGALEAAADVSGSTADVPQQYSGSMAMFSIFNGLEIQSAALQVEDGIEEASDNDGGGGVFDNGINFQSPVQEAEVGGEASVHGGVLDDGGVSRSHDSDSNYVATGPRARRLPPPSPFLPFPPPSASFFDGASDPATACSGERGGCGSGPPVHAAGNAPVLFDAQDAWQLLRAGQALSASVCAPTVVLHELVTATSVSATSATTAATVSTPPTICDPGDAYAVVVAVGQHRPHAAGQTTVSEPSGDPPLGTSSAAAKKAGGIASDAHRSTAASLTTSDDGGDCAAASSHRRPRRRALLFGCFGPGGR